MDPASWAAAVEATGATFGDLDVLVNNAVVSGGTRALFDIEPSQLQAIIDVNLTGMFLGLQAAVRAMSTSGGGSIINISSILGLRGIPITHA